VRSLDRAGHQSHTGGLREGIDHRFEAGIALRGAALATEAPESFGHDGNICGQAVHRSTPRHHAFSEDAPKILEALPRPAGDGSHRNLVETVLSQHSLEVDEAIRSIRRPQLVDAVEGHQHDCGMAPQWTQIAVVESRIRILLRVHDPHEQVHELHQTINLDSMCDLGRIVVGEIQQHHAVQA
jgi:hypothetical protein